MNDADVRLDGNAAAGVLSEVFSAEMTTALGTCASCGATNAFGSVLVYAQAPGTVLRCPSCSAVLICIVRLPDGLLVNLSGVQRIRVDVTDSRAV